MWHDQPNISSTLQGIEHLANIVIFEFVEDRHQDIAPDP